ncbi:MAG TPA: c-type cytochrome [Gammaproteobacteria bacterium]|nr:c-type cytochrome [Gammaproteobacteria bacterium]
MVFVKDIDMEPGSNIKRSLVTDLSNISGWVIVSAVLIALFFIVFQLVSPFSSVASLEVHRLAGKQLALGGRADIPACASCHGLQGQGNEKTAIPRLAGLHPDYIKKQLEDYARSPLKTRAAVEPIARDYIKTPRTYGDLTVFTPGIRQHSSMNKLARMLSAEDRHNLAVYYSELTFVAAPKAYDFETLERGEDLALRGKPEYGLPACDSCHGPRGQGFGAIFPPLVGQPVAYIIAQINHWQTGKRDNDHLALMRNVADQLTDGDKVNVAAYYDNLSYSVNRE